MTNQQLYAKQAEKLIKIKAKIKESEEKLASLEAERLTLLGEMKITRSNIENDALREPIQTVNIKHKGKTLGQKVGA